MNDWIDINKSKPDDDDEVIAWDGFDISIARISKFGIIAIADGESVRDSEGDYVWLNYVTHWMSLPKAPSVG